MLVGEKLVLKYNQHYKSSNNNQENRFGFFHSKNKSHIPKKNMENNTHHKIQEQQNSKIKKQKQERNPLNIYTKA